jgi:cell division protein FtsW (lipid II flippase)
VALITSLGLLFIVRFKTDWSERTQVEWTGFEVVGQPLVVGGPRDQAAVGWPNEAFSPILKVTARDEHTGAVEISGSEAFLYDEGENRFLNGTVIPIGSSRKIGDFSLRLSPHYYLWQRLDVVDSNNEVWASFDLPTVLIKRDRVYALSERVEAYSVEKVRENPAQLVKLENWADDFRLLLTVSGEVRVLGDENQQGHCEFPCKLSLFSVNRRLQFQINRDGAKLLLCYPPPRQMTAPLPPAGPNGQQLVVTGEPRPGDIAFSLPLGHGIQDPRRTIALARNAAGATVISTPGAVAEENRSVYLPEGFQREKVTPCSEADVTSRIGIQTGNTILNFATVTNLPNLGRLAFMVSLAFVCFVLGLVIAFPRMPDDRTRWVLYGLAAVCWNLLSFRLLLALRYAISPSNLDFLVVKGVTTALVGLALVPSLLLLTSRFKRDLYERPDTAAGKKKALIFALAYVATLFIIVWQEYSGAPKLWLDLPLRFNPQGGTSFSGYLLMVFSLVSVSYLVLIIFALYKSVPTASPARKRMVRIVLWPFSDVLGKMLRRSKRIWTWAIADVHWTWLTWIAFSVFAILVVPIFICLLAIGVSALFGAFSKLAAVDTFFHDIIVPLLFFWPLALVWLAGRIFFSPGTKLPPFRRLFKNPSLVRRMVRISMLALSTISCTVFVVPVIIKDVGSILAGAAIMLPVAFLLLAAAPRRWGAVAFLAVLAGFAAAAYSYANIRSISPYLPERVEVAASRLLVFKEGNNIQRYMPFTSTFGGQLQKLRDGYQHTWENQAIAHEGGLTGLGFGAAPTQRSQVRQDTLQYDSVFSFFVVSEHGLLGGSLLLIVYMLPLIIILIGGRLRFDFGYAVACVITSSMLLEALTHAAMNFDLFPFTGRDLPLLTVNSVTDLMRWAILFCLVAQMVLTRYRGGHDLKTDPDSISILTPLAQTAPPVVREPLKHYVPALISILVLPVVILASVIWVGVAIYRDSDKHLSMPFSWSGILEVVDGMARDNLIVVKKDQTLEINPSLPVSPGMLIEQEIARFNALTLEERTGQAGLSNYRERFRQATSRADYEKILDDIRKDPLSERRRPRRVSLFKLLPPFRWNDGMQIKEIGGYRLIANREFNTQVSFKSGVDNADFPHTTFRDGQGMLIGPAWVRGKWVQTFDAEPAIPWTEHLMGVLEAEWARLGKSDAVKDYGTLSLDRKLQEAADTFVATRGWELHDQLLRSDRSQTTLPPRVAFTILSVPSGEALALAGWPRMTSSKFWTKSRDRKEWIPPAHWVEREAPEYLRNLYQGDRNFDRMVMGSSTKPLWAAAVLSVHPNLDERLMTRGSESLESDVFGIPLPFGWEAHPSGKWVDFRTYLAQSDNRYQVRLGFLGLAEAFGGEVTDQGSSNSEKESLRGSPPQPWRRFPKFPPEMNFSNVQPGPFRKLEDMPLSKSLKSMFSFGITGDDFSYRRSFWTKNEPDDLSNALVSRSRLAIFNAISPQAVDLSFDRVSLPRDYVTLLLGGGTNLWANADFATAFATCVTGQPLLAHVVKNENPLTMLPDRKAFPEIAAKIRPGLMAVLTDGTGRVTELTGALAALKKPAGAKFYAKTGTLSERNDALNTSRIVLAIVRWDDERKGKVRGGLVFSLVVERGGMATSTRWLGEFISTYHSEIERFLAQ